MAITVIRYSDRPELWADTDAVSQAVWPEYNNHGEVLNRYWGRLFEEFPEFRSSFTTTRTEWWPRATRFRVLGMARRRGWATGSTR